MKIKTDQFAKIPMFIAQHAFEFALGFLLLALIIGITIFYVYNILAQKTELTNLGQSCPLEDAVYKNISDIWQKHDKIIEDSATKNYRNLFSTN